MKAPVLLSFVAASLLLIILIEILAQRSHKVGGLSLVREAEDLPGAVTFGYLYLPTIVAVIYSLIWNWVDLDVKRMQPWLELSRPEGALGSDSLFLDYPFDFVATVPFKAARRKHWPVFYSGTITVLIFWLLTPLQSAVLGTGVVHLQIKGTASNTKTLMNSTAQAVRIDQSILIADYAMNWLDQPYPPFTTSEYALLPFKAQDATLASKKGANVTGKTIKYWTELTCSPATMSPLGTLPGQVNIANGKGCSLSDYAIHPGIPQTNQYKMRYVGWQNSAWAEYFLAGPLCNETFSHQFLVSWGKWINKTQSVDMAGTFCETAYYKQKVQATVSADDQSPLDDGLVSLSEPEQMSVSEFNSSALEYLFGSGVSPVEIPRDYPFQGLVEYYQRIESSGLGYPVGPMISSALSSQNYTMDDYADTSVLETAFRAVHKSMFALALSGLLDSHSGGDTSESIVSVVRYGVIVSRLFSALVEAALGLAALLVVLLYSTSRNSPSMVARDPGSLRSLILTIQKSDTVLDRFCGKSMFTDEKLMAALGHQRFHLLCGCRDQSEESKLTLRDEGGVSENDSQCNRDLPGTDSTQAGYYRPVRPWALKRGVGLIFLLVLCAAIAALAVVEQIGSDLGGFKPPSSSFEVNLILTSFLPTAFSTLIEPFWVLLARYLCILQPFEDLRKNDASGERSLEARFTAVPPQLAIWQAIKTKRLGLIVVSTVALLANILAVGLGGLFNELSVTESYNSSFVVMKQQKFAKGGIADFFSTIISGPATYQDPFYVAMANLSNGTPLPPWMNQDFYFLPLKPSKSHSSGAATYQAETYGVGIEPGCVAIGPLITTNKAPSIDTTFGRSGPTPKGCNTKYSPTSLSLQSRNYIYPEGPSAVEVVDTMTPGLNNYNVSQCAEQLVVGWSRANLVNSTGILHTSLINCKPSLKTARFNVTFTSEGYILSANATTAFRDHFDQPDSNAQYSALVSHMNQRFRDRIKTQWHNDSTASNWMSYLLKVNGSSPDLLRPDADVPDAGTMLPRVSSLYRMLFAIFVNVNPAIFEDAENHDTLKGTRTVTEARIFVSSPALIVTLTILGLYVVTAIGYYGWAINLFLPRTPTTIGSLIAYVASSRVVREYAPDWKRPEQTFGFGRYRGADGKAHIGINFSENVVPLELSSFAASNTQPTSSMMGRLWHRTRPKGQGDTWL